MYPIQRRLRRACPSVAMRSSREYNPCFEIVIQHHPPLCAVRPASSAAQNGKRRMASIAKGSARVSRYASSPDRGLPVGQGRRWVHEGTQNLYSRLLSLVHFVLPHLIEPTSTNRNRENMDGAFRKINIDLLEEDVLLPSDLYDPDPRGPDGVMADARNRSGEVRGLVSK
jgi:hypothetical protein